VTIRAFDVLGDPVRRRVLELLAKGEQSAGTIVEAIQREFGISQAGVSQHLKVLRESGLVSVRTDGQRRVYSVDSTPLQEVDSWLNALTSEIARGKRKRCG
jgi:DNA-binding transcriptional ArsR family regulator